MVLTPLMLVQLIFYTKVNMERTEYNCSTGEYKVIQLTQSEIDAIPVYIPQKVKLVSMRQARLALLQSGLLTQVNTAISNMTGLAGDQARVVWEFSNTVERDNPLISQLGVALNLTSNQLDDLFTLANTL